MAFDGTLKFDTAIDKTGFKLGVDSLGGVAKKGMAVVTSAVGAASAAVTALGGYAVSVGKDFEGSMAQVIATMGITKDTVQDGVNSYDLLKEAAASAGESTTFSASEAADALNYLALAGYDAAKAADALPAVLDLAAAGGLDLAYASDLATDAMAALGIEANSENLTRFGDEMAKTASKANTSVAQLGEAILTVGGTAKSLAGGTTELNAALGVLANRGIKGAEGGTALRNMILALSAPTDKAAEAIANLGLEVFDAAGNMRPMNEIFGDLDSALSEISEGEKTQVLNEIFNKVDLKSAQAMLAGCGAEFSELSAEISACDGAMSQMAETMNDTLEGDLKSLSSKAEAFGIAMYEGLNEPLRELVQKGGEYISQLTSAFKDGGFDGLAERLGDVLASAVAEISGYIPKIIDMAVSLIHSLAEGLIKNAPAITESLISAVKSLILGILSVSSDLFELGGTLLLSLLSGISAELPEILNTAIPLINTLIDGISDLIPQLIPIALEIVQTIANALAENLPVIIPKMHELSYQIVEALTAPDFLSAVIEAALLIISALLDGFVAATPVLMEYLPQIIENIVVVLLEAIPMLIGAIADMFEDTAQMICILSEPVSNAVSSAWESFCEAFSDGCNEIKNIFSSAWESFCDAFSDGCDEIKNMFSSAFESVKQWFSDMIENAKQSASDFVAGAMTFLNELPGKLGEMLGKALGTIAKWTSEITEKAKETASEFIENVRGFISQLPSTAKEHLDNMVSNVVEWAVEITERAKETASEFIENVKEFISQLPSTAKEHLDNMVSNVVEWAVEVTEKAKETASEFIENVRGFISQLPFMAKEHLDNMVSNVVEWAVEITEKAKETASEFIENVKEFISQLPSTAKEHLDNMIFKVRDWSSEITEKAKKAASEFIENVRGFIQQLPSMAKEHLDNMVSKVVDWASEITEKAKETASEFIENVKEFISQLPSTAKEHLDNMISQVKEWASEITLKAKNTAREFLENIKEFIRQLPSMAKEHLDNTISKVKEWATDLKNKGKEAADGLVEKITSTIRTLPDKMAEAGKNLVEGLWNGITGAGDWLKGRISDFGSGIINGFKESFGIHSPSTVMRDSVGKYLAQGIGVGFAEEMPSVRKTAVNAAEQIVPDMGAIRAFTVNSAVSDNTIIQPSVTSEITNNYAYSTVNNTNSSESVQSVTFNVRLGIDGEDIVEGAKNIILNEVDKQQGIDIQLKKRGLTT